MLADTQPEIFRTENANPAGDLSISDPDTAAGDPMVVETGDQFVIEVSDANDTNCNGLVSAEHIGFNGVPTVSIVSGPTVEVQAELRASTAGVNVQRGGGAGVGCTGFSPTTLDQLVITVSQAPDAGAAVAAINISGIKYDVGGLADVGDVTLHAAVDDAPAAGYEHQITTGTPASNGYITNIEVTVGDGIAIQPGANRAAPDITFRETEPDASTPDGTVGAICVELQDLNVSFVGTPTITTTTGTDVVSGPAVIDGGDALRFVVTDGGVASESTFTLSNIHVDTQAGQFGAEHIQVFQCDETTDVSTETPIVPATQTPTTPAPDASDVTAYTTNERIFVTVVRALRFAGLDRFETAQAIADRTFDCSHEAVIARGDLFPDALAGNYVAGQLYAPILLVNTDSIPGPTLEALKTMGVDDVYIMGGTSAVSAAVASQLDATTNYTCGGGAPERTQEDAIRTINVTRVGGVDRFATARLAGLFGGADQVGTLDLDGTDNNVRTAILANGLNFPDALTAGPMAFQGFSCGISSELNFEDCRGFPLVLANGSASTLPSATNSFLSEQAIQQVIIVGGTAAVPQAIEDDLVSQGIRVIRLSGADRQGTAVDIADFERDVLEYDCTTVDPPAGDTDLDGSNLDACPNPIVSIARGDDFADALTMGPHAGVYNHPILLTGSPTDLTATTTDYLGVLGSEGVFRLDIAGGTAAISNAVVQSAISALGGV